MALLISEILFNPPGTDAPNEFVEIIGDASATIASGVYLVGIETFRRSSTCPACRSEPTACCC